MEIAESEYQRFYMASKFSYVEPDIIEMYLEIQPETITFKGISKEQIKRSISCFPENILLYPEIFNEAEKTDVEHEKKEKYKQIFENINAETKYEQLSIWDIIIS